MQLSVLAVRRGGGGGEPRLLRAAAKAARRRGARRGETVVSVEVVFGCFHVHPSLLVLESQCRKEETGDVPITFPFNYYLK